MIELKISPQYFDDVDSGKKPFEVRRDDRPFAVGDTLLLREWSGDYTGRSTFKVITYILRDSDYCKDGYCILGLSQRKRPNDNVNHPAHYNTGDIECINVIQAATVELDGFEGFCIGNAIKYLWRWKHKGGKEDLQKAKWYIETLTENEEKAHK